VPIPEQHVTSILSGNFAWDMNGETPVAFTRMYLDGVPYNILRQLELALTPHGALKAGLAATDATAITTPIVGASDFGLSQFGRKVTIVSFTVFGKYKMNVTVNDQNLVELVDTWFPNPVYGDMDYEMRYTQYKDFGGIKFPQLVHVHQGDPRLNPAHNYYEFKITDVKGNVPVEKMPVPEAVRNATIAPAKVESEKLADGVWALTGGTHNSMLVEFKDFVAVVEAPNNEARSLAVIAEAARLAPNKPISGEHASPFRSRRWPADVPFTGDGDRHPRVEQAVLPRHHVLPGAADARSGSHGNVLADVHDQQAPSAN
jgi:hypothetical protein